VNEIIWLDKKTEVKVINAFFTIMGAFSKSQVPNFLSVITGGKKKNDQGKSLDQYNLSGFREST